MGDRESVTPRATKQEVQQRSHTRSGKVILVMTGGRLSVAGQLVTVIPALHTHTGNQAEITSPITHLASPAWGTKTPHQWGLERIDMADMGLVWLTAARQHPSSMASSENDNKRQQPRCQLLGSITDWHRLAPSSIFRVSEPRVPCHAG